MNDENSLQWNKEIIVRSIELDNQHKYLVEIIYELCQALSKDEPEGILGSFLDRLSRYVDYHFKMEKLYFEMFNYDEKENHKIEYLKFKEKIDEFKVRNKSNDNSLASELLLYLKNWLLDHIKISDQNSFNWVSNALK